uniref:Uncharacterized protein n=1 Tax=Acrobeloides nanus TaxID=290746 RepID=A0A914DI53_9BILA
MYGNEVNVLTFIVYIRDTWLSSKENGWTEGHSEWISNNNGLECCNRSIKDLHTFRKNFHLTILSLLRKPW